MWPWMDDGAEKMLRMSGLTEQFYVDALIAYVITYNQEETGANKLGHGEAPWKTMGIRCYRPERLRTFGAFGWHLIREDPAFDGWTFIARLRPWRSLMVFGRKFVPTAGLSVGRSGSPGTLTMISGAELWT